MLEGCPCAFGDDALKVIIIAGRNDEIVRVVLGSELLAVSGEPVRR